MQPGPAVGAYDTPTDLLVGWGRLLESPGKPVGMFCMKSVIHDWSE